MSKQQAWKIARTIAGLCVAAGLIYFLYSDRSPLVTWLIILAVVFFIALKRRSGGDDKNPYLRRLAMVSSRKPLRDFALAVACFVAMIAVILAILAGIDHNLLPDNKVTMGILWMVIIAGIAGVMWFMSGIITRVVYGPPPP